MPAPPSPAAATATWRLRLFGPPMLAQPRGLLPLVPERAHQLIALLAVRRGEWVPRELLAALFWPDRSAGEARRNLRKVLFKARALAGADALEASEHALCWHAQTDLAALPELEGAALRGLRRGVLLEGLEDPALASWGEWLDAQRAQAHAQWRSAVLKEAHAAAGRDERIAAAEALLRLDPLDEEAVALLVDEQLAAGRAAQARRSLDEYATRLRTALGVEPARALRERLGPAVPAALSTPSALPLPEGFVGRRTEFEELHQLVLATGARLVTVLGPGGAGKSTLVRHALPELAARGGLEPVWVDLVDLMETAALPARLAQALGIEAGGGADLERALGHALAATPRLVVLDNAEHLGGLGARLEAWLEAAPALRLLVTSRARLHARGEVLLPLGGLAVPDEDSHDFEVASRFDAVRLFELRAKAARTDFELRRHLGSVIEIVQTVAGMPLAIELAASWVRLLPPAQIALDLRGSIDLLERDPGQPGAAPRPDHASMRAVLDRAWALLGPREQQALAALSVFRGGFVPAAAREVAAVSMPLVSALADKSLLAIGEQGRLDLHPLVAAYAAERLALEAAARGALHLRHAEYHARLLEALAPHATGDIRRLVAGVTPELSNARVAWGHALALGRADLAARMVRALWGYFENRNRQREGVELLEPGLAAPLDGAAARLLHARLRHGLSMLHHRLNEQPQGLALAEGGIELAAASGDLEAHLGCVLNTGTCLWEMGRNPEARARFEQGVAIAEGTGAPKWLGWARGNLAVALLDSGHPQEAHALLQQALGDSRAAGDLYNIGVHLINLSAALGDMNRAREGCQVLEEAERHCDAHGLVAVGMAARQNLAHQLTAIGELERARQLYLEALASARRMGGQRLEWGLLGGLARVCTQQQDLAAARMHLHELARQARAAHATIYTAIAASIEADIRAAAGDPAGAARAWACALQSGALPARYAERIEAKVAQLPEPLRSTPAPTFDELFADGLR